jgi:rRNA maturation endonuclease Nob1
MGFFNSAGKTVERLKQTATEAADEAADYQCRTCEERFHTEHEECPDCGAATVERLQE